MDKLPKPGEVYEGTCKIDKQYRRFLITSVSDDTVFYAESGNTSILHIDHEGWPEWTKTWERLL